MKGREQLPIMNKLLIGLSWFFLRYFDIKFVILICYNILFATNILCVNSLIKEAGHEDTVPPHTAQPGFIGRVALPRPLGRVAGNRVRLGADLLNGALNRQKRVDTNLSPSKFLSMQELEERVRRLATGGDSCGLAAKFSGRVNLLLKEDFGPLQKQRVAKVRQSRFIAVIDGN